jgi:DNA-binding transcriptional MerR regulator
MATNTYDIKHLCDISGVSLRTVYFYVQQGLLPHPGARGPGARYDRRHLLRLQLIGKLKEEHLPLAEIREKLAALSDAQVEQAVTGVSEPPPTAGTTPTAAPARSQWDRIALTKDVELHVRRPLPRERNRQVERLLEEARRIMRQGGR